MNADQVRQYLEYYRDLGFETLYRRSTAMPLPGEAEPELPATASGGDSLAHILDEIGDCKRCRTACRG